MLGVSAELQIDLMQSDGTELLDAMVTSVFLLDEDLRVTYLNAAAQTLLGLGSNQALGRPIAELTRGAEGLLPMFERVRGGGEGVVQRELAWSAPGSVDRILDCAVTQVILGGKSLRLLLEIEDITQHRSCSRGNCWNRRCGNIRA
jgi:two-component system nitrogen regulation sensor histidine kinase GlnL